MDNSERFEMYERVHLRSNDDLSPQEKISKLTNKHRSKWLQIILNFVIIIGLGYAYFTGYQPFPQWVYYILAGIFVLNVVMLHIQKNQITALIDYLKSESE